MTVIIILQYLLLEFQQFQSKAKKPVMFLALGQNHKPRLYSLLLSNIKQTGLYLETSILYLSNQNKQTNKKSRIPHATRQAKVPIRLLGYQWDKKKKKVNSLSEITVHSLHI